MDALNERGATDTVQSGGLCSLRPRDGALAAFVATLLPVTPVLASFDQTAQFPVLADPFLIVALCAALVSALVLLGRSLA